MRSDLFVTTPQRGRAKLMAPKSMLALSRLGLLSSSMRRFLAIGRALKRGSWAKSGTLAFACRASGRQVCFQV